MQSMITTYVVYYIKKNNAFRYKCDNIYLLYLLHYEAFFHVASLLSPGVDNEKVGVDNEKALELTNSTFFYRGRQWKSSRAGQQNMFSYLNARTTDQPLSQRWLSSYVVTIGLELFDVSQVKQALWLF